MYPWLVAWSIGGVLWRAWFVAAGIQAVWLAFQRARTRGEILLNLVLHPERWPPLVRQPHGCLFVGTFLLPLGFCIAAEFGYQVSAS